MVPTLIRMVAFGAIAYLAYRVIRPSHHIRMTLTSDGVMIAKGVSQELRRLVDEFAREQLLDGEEIKLKGYFIDNGRIRWVFPRNVNSALAQRFRNLTLLDSDRQ